MTSLDTLQLYTRILGIDKTSPGLRLVQSFRGYFDVYNFVGTVVVITMIAVGISARMQRKTRMSSCGVSSWLRAVL